MFWVSILSALGLPRLRRSRPGWLARFAFNGFQPGISLPGVGRCDKRERRLPRQCRADDRGALGPVSNEDTGAKPIKDPTPEQLNEVFCRRTNDTVDQLCQRIFAAENRVNGS